jgi:type II secretory pathway pseudopilin PulG
MVAQLKNRFFNQPPSNKIRRIDGFTIIEVLIAATIMIILCVGVLSVFSYVTKINRGENLRAQALSVLQQEVERYRSLKFVPIGSSSELNGGDYPNIRTRPSADGRVFNISVTIDNAPYTAGIQTSSNVPEATCKFKEITITAVPKVAETGWLANLRTNVTIQRVRSN